MAGGGRADGGYSYDDMPLVAAYNERGLSEYGVSPPTVRASGGDAGHGSEAVIITGGGPKGGQISGAVSSKWAKGTGGPAGDECYNLVAFNGRQDPDVSGPITGPLGSQSPQDQCIAFSMRGRGGESLPEAEPDDVAPALRTGGGGSSHQFVATEDVKAFTVSAQANGLAWESDAHPTVQAHPQSETSDRQIGLRIGSCVRRITCTEAERLQGFPDGWTDIPWRGKSGSPDGPRYKAIGNSKPTNVVRWIGRRLAANWPKRA